jgi:hypothetical protein
MWCVNKRLIKKPNFGILTCLGLTIQSILSLTCWYFLNSDLASRARAGGVRARMGDDNDEETVRESESYEAAASETASKEDDEESEATIADRDAREELRKDRKREIKHELRKEQIKNEARKAGKVRSFVILRVIFVCIT